MVNGPIVPVGHGAFQLHSRPGASVAQPQTEDYYDEEEDYGDEAEYGAETEGPGQQRVSGGRVLTLEQEQEILHFLAMSARNNREFLKVLNIL